MNREATLCFVTLLLAASTLHSETIVHDVASGVWTIDGSPYVIEGTVVVPANSSLEIEPGVVIQLGTTVPDRREWFTLDSLIVLGTLTAEGTPQLPITFVRKPGFDYAGCLSLAGVSATFAFVDFEGFVHSNQNSTFNDCRFLRASGNSGVKVANRDGFGDAGAVPFLRCRWEETGLSCHSGFISLQNCKFQDGTVYSESGSRVIIDACSSGTGAFYVTCNRDDDCKVTNSVLEGVTARPGYTSLIVDHCMIRGNGINFAFSEHTRITNNTFIDGSGVAITEDGGDFAHIKNNIFYRPVLCFRYDGEVNERFYNISHNIIFEPEDISDYIDEMGINNIDLDPLLQGGDPFDIHIRRGSPAINRGDPDLPRDPDGSRSDIGAIPFDNQLNLPPILHAPAQFVSQIDEYIELIVTIEDDGRLARFEIEDAPVWLERLNPRLWDDTLMLAGRPEGRDIPTELIITIIATDLDGASVSKQVRISLWRSELRGRLAGRLSEDDSPYMITGNCRINGGDALFVQPGVEIVTGHFDDFVGFTLEIDGVLILNGTPENRSRFRRIDDLGSLLVDFGEHGELIGRHADLEEITLGVFERNAVDLEDCQLKQVRVYGREVNLNRCEVIGGSISSLERARLSISNSSFIGSSIVSDAVNNSIQNCQFIDCLDFGAVNIGRFQGGSALVEGCTFTNCIDPLYAWVGDTLRVENNTFQNCHEEENWGSMVEIGAGYAQFSGNQFLNNRLEPWRYFEPDPALVSFSHNGDSDLVFINHNLFFNNVGNVVIRGFDSVAITQNTFVDGECRLIAQNAMTGVCWNNIFTRTLIHDDEFLHPNGPIDEDYNIFFEMVANDDVLIGEHSQNVDPGFIGIDPQTYQLRRNSPLIDSGSQGITNDPDNTQSDIGYWPYDHRNHPPEVERDDRDTLRANPGEEIIFRLTVSDEEDDSLVYRWFVDGVLTGMDETMRVTTPDEGELMVVGYVMDGNDFDSCGWVLQTSFAGVGDAPAIPRDYALHPVYPNPFNSRAMISFDLPTAGEAGLTIYDLQGRLVARLWDGRAEAGRMRVAFDAAGLPSGSYVMDLEAGGKRFQQKALLLK